MKRKPVAGVTAANVGGSPAKPQTAAKLNPEVLKLGFVSLLTDLSSEARRDQAGPLFASGGMTTFAVSKVQLDPGGRVTAVLWGEVDTVKNAWATPEVVVPVTAAVDALRAGDQVFALFPSMHGHVPDRRFVVAEYDGSRKTIVLDGPTTYEREVHDMDRLSGPAPR